MVSTSTRKCKGLTGIPGSWHSFVSCHRARYDIFHLGHANHEAGHPVHAWSFLVCDCAEDARFHGAGGGSSCCAAMVAGRLTLRCAAARPGQFSETLKSDLLRT